MGPMGLLRLPLKFFRWGKLRPKSSSTLWTAMIRMSPPGMWPLWLPHCSAQLCLGSHTAGGTTQDSGKDFSPGLALVTIEPEPWFALWEGTPL